MTKYEPTADFMRGYAVGFTEAWNLSFWSGIALLVMGFLICLCVVGLAI